MKPNPEVGQQIYSLNVGNAARRSPSKLREFVVVSVGRKYFTACPVGAEKSLHQHNKYHLGSWVQETNYLPDSQLYTSEQEYLDEKESESLSKEIFLAFESGRNQKRLSLETLRNIKSLIP